MPISEAAAYLGVSMQTLRRWDAIGTLRALKSPGGHRYYQRETLERFRGDSFGLANAWAASEVAPEIPQGCYSDTQDRFRARLERMAKVIQAGADGLASASLVTSVAGEVGNNSFDHNLGSWPDVPGIFFSYDHNKRIVVLADRGVGIRATLSRVRADLQDDVTALEVAMTEYVSGRSPEQRGNGLKYVRDVAEGNPIAISLQSGTAVATVGKKDGRLKIGLAGNNVRGVVTKIEY
ncbi:MAG: helix-turn-helix domain-containing protein [Patescibacteria group bacterium]|nr:helix-turn-helix domain-containing protein [Patescibacteria group bacterium]